MHAFDILGPITEIETIAACANDDDHATTCDKAAIRRLH